MSLNISEQMVGTFVVTVLNDNWTDLPIGARLFKVRLCSEVLTQA